jgi:hypothetical protein
VRTQVNVSINQNYKSVVEDMYETKNLSFNKSGSMDNSFMFTKVIDETKLIVDNTKNKDACSQTSKKEVRKRIVSPKPGSFEHFKS